MRHATESQEAAELQQAAELRQAGEAQEPAGGRVARLAAWNLATWFGCGWSPFAPGTAGALGAMVPAVLLGEFAHWPAWTFAVLAALGTGPGIWAASCVSRESGKKDPGFVVVDEVLGTWLALAGATALNWKSYLGAFLLFRLFDIWKPFPVRRLEALPGGTGIVVDDLMAGLYGALVLFAAGCFNFY